MLKRDYYVYALKQQLYLKRAWLLAVYGIIQNGFHVEDIGISISDNACAVTLESGTIEIIEDFKYGKTLFGRAELVDFNAGDMNCIKENITSTYGLAFLNALLFEYPYNGKVPYVNKVMSPATANAIALDMLMKDSTTIEEHLRFENAVNMTYVLSQTGIPSATRKSITPNPQIKKAKEDLFKEYEGRLNDMSAVAELQSRLDALDRAYLKGDDSTKFLIGGKARISRLKRNCMVGAEQDFINETQINVMQASLSEGWTARDMPQMANTIRGGSYNRGANTALGGYEVKVLSRIFQNATINIEPCNTKEGLDIVVDETAAKWLPGRYLLSNPTAPLTIDTIKPLLGKRIFIRSPAYCLSSGNSYCKTCLGDTVANVGIGLTAQMTSLGSAFLVLFLKLSHGNMLAVEEYKPELRIT